MQRNMGYLMRALRHETAEHLGSLLHFDLGDLRPLLLKWKGGRNKDKLRLGGYSHRVP